MAKDGLAVADPGHEVVEGDPLFLAVEAEDIGLIGHILVFQVGEEGVEDGEVEAGEEASAIDIQAQRGCVAAVADVLIGKTGTDGDMFEQVVAELGGDIDLDHGAELHAEATPGKEAAAEGELALVDLLVGFLGRGRSGEEEGGGEAEDDSGGFQHI